MPHHLMKEKDLKNQCIYCGNFISTDKKQRWYSYVSDNIHYKTFNCSCGKLHSIKVQFESSGHDNWDKKEWISLQQLDNIRKQVKKNRLENMV